MPDLSSASWDPTWEQVFRRQEWGKYPPEELVRFTARNFYKTPDRAAVRMLDIGCGTGAATWFLAREGFSASGIDGSETAIDIARKRFEQENLKADFMVGDFLRLPYPDASFDCVVDVVALQHNRPEKIAETLREVRRILKPGGRVFSMMLSGRTRRREDLNAIKDKGFVHVFERDEIDRLFAEFRGVTVETVERTDRGNLIAHFIVTAEK